MWLVSFVKLAPKREHARKRERGKIHFLRVRTFPRATPCMRERAATEARSWATTLPAQAHAIMMVAAPRSSAAAAAVLLCAWLRSASGAPCSTRGPGKMVVVAAQVPYYSLEECQYMYAAIAFLLQSGLLIVMLQRVRVSGRFARLWVRSSTVREGSPYID